MKKFMCIAIIICILPVCSFAIDLTEFNANVVALGEEAIIESSAEKTGNTVIYTAGNCKFMFDEEGNTITRIIVQGNGTSFLVYAMAAIMVFDHNPNAFDENAGKLFSSFLLAKNNGLQSKFVSSGEMFIINPIDNAFYFTIGK